MRLIDVLTSCGRMEERAAALYRRFAGDTPPQSPFLALWNDMAHEEDAHAAAVRDAQWDAPSRCGWRVQLDGWSDAMKAVAETLRLAEQLSPAATDDERIAAAFAIELGEMDALRHAAIGAVHRERSEAADDHLARLAEAAAAHSSDPHVLALVAIARARRRLAAVR